MQKLHRAAFGAALGAIGLVACEPASPPGAAVSPPVERPGAEAPAFLAEPGTLLEVIRLDDPYDRALRLGAVLPVLGPAAAPLAREIIEDPSLVLAAADLELLLRFWASHQPEEAALWALTQSPQNLRVVTILAAFEEWGRLDPQAARRASEARIAQVGEARDAVQLALVRGWYRHDPDELARYIHELGVGFTRLRALSAFLREMVRDQGAEAVIRWAEAIPDENETYKTAVFRQLASALALLDHQAAIRWCEAHCDGPFGKNLRNVIARHWVRMDGAAALAWLSGAPEGQERDGTVRHAFATWGRWDRPAALAWMAEQTEAGAAEPWLRPAIPVYAKLLSADSPTEAIRWAERIEEADAREVELMRAARAWRRIDPAAAEAWLEESSLSEEARAKVRQPALQPRPPAP